MPSTSIVGYYPVCLELAFALWCGARVKFAPAFQSDCLGKKFHMPIVKVKENEPFDVALRRFKRSCEKAGVLSEVRRREFYEKPTSVRKRKAAAAVKRHAKKLQRESRRFEKAF